MAENKLVKKSDLRSIMRSDDITLKFREALGQRDAGGYISNVLITVAQSEALQKCTPVSIITAALRAATMRLSVDLTSGQAYLVPFKDKATLVIGYKGLIHLALRTGKYRHLNVNTIYEGEELVEDRITGLHSLKDQCVSKTPIGHLLYIEMINGFIKTFFMTCQECDDHGRKYSRAYHLENSLWKLDPEKMHAKTMIRLGLSAWGYLEPADRDGLAAIEDEQAQILDVPAEVEEEPIEPGQAMLELGFS